MILTKKMSLRKSVETIPKRKYADEALPKHRSLNNIQLL